MGPKLAECSAQRGRETGGIFRLLQNTHRVDGLGGVTPSIDREVSVLEAFHFVQDGLHLRFGQHTRLRFSSNWRRAEAQREKRAITERSIIHGYKGCNQQKCEVARAPPGPDS